MYLNFDAQKHLYILTDGITDEVLPSVTQILSAEGFIPNNGSEWHMEKGSHVHKMIELYLQGVLDEDTLDPLLSPYLQGFRQFQADSGIEIQGVETPMYHPQYLYAGTPDIWGSLNNVSTLIDVKTGSAAKWHLLQLAAYCGLLQSNGGWIRQAANLYLSETGGYTMSKPLGMKELTHCMQVFLSALTLYKWKKENL